MPCFKIIKIQEDPSDDIYEDRDPEPNEPCDC